MFGGGRHQRARILEEIEASRAERADSRAFIREQTALMQRTARSIEERVAASVAEERRQTDEIVFELRQMRDQIRANTQAVLRMLDRLPPNGGPEPATG